MIINIKRNTPVTVDFGNYKIKGIIVGKATTDLSQTHIIKCTDETLPNNEYDYDTFVAPIGCIGINNKE